MGTEQELELRVISLRDLWRVFKSRFVLMALAAALVAGGAFAFNQLTFKPRYESTATLYILRQADEQSRTDSTTYNDFTLALRLVNDCNYILKSHSTLDPVLKNLGLGTTYADLYDSITVSNPDDTRILAVSVEADTPEEAKRIVDEVCSIGIVQIDEAMGFAQVKLFEEGILNEAACNTMPLAAYAILGILAAFAIYVVFLVSFLLDDRIRSDEDIERMLGLSLLGDIPNSNSSSKGRRYKGYYGSRYGDAACEKTPIATSVPTGSAVQEAGLRDSNSSQMGHRAKQHSQSSPVTPVVPKANPRTVGVGKAAGVMPRVPQAISQSAQKGSTSQQVRQSGVKQAGKKVR